MARISIILAVGLALCVSVAASLVAFAQEGSEGSQPADLPSSGSASTPLVEAFGLPLAADDALPVAAAQELALRTVPGLEAANTVRALSAGPWDIYLTPARGGACLSIGDRIGGASVACFSREALQAGDGSPAGGILTGCRAVSPEAPVCQNVVLYGVVPDRVDQISVETEAGSSATATVENNAYLVELPLSSRPRAVRYTADQGTVVQYIP